jgi:aarF domain-containing kinase
MAGKRLVDLAALFKAGRGVAQKHIALREHQLDVFTRTSTLAKAIKNQTDRITETAKAASFLASKLNDDRPAWTQEATDTSQPQALRNEPIPSTKSTETDIPKAKTNLREGIEQDHFYEKSPSNSAREPTPKETLDIYQESAQRHPLPDGTIPPIDSNINKPNHSQGGVGVNSPEPSKSHLGQDSQASGQLDFQPISRRSSTIPTPRPIPKHENKPLSSFEAREFQRIYEDQIPSKPADGEDFVHSKDPLEQGHDEDSVYTPSKHTSPVLSSLPRVKLPKHTSNTQGIDEHLNGDINSDSYSSTVENLKRHVDSEMDVPEGVNINVFLNPRVAKNLSGKAHARNLPTHNVKTPSMVFREDRRPEKNPDDELPNPAAPSPAETPASNVGTFDARSSGQSTDRLTDEKQVASNVEAAAILYQMKESKVPSSRIARMWNYGGLAAGMFGGVLSEGIKRATGSGTEGSYILSPANMDRLVAKLSRMRGAALKMGQMISFQDSKMLPAQIQEVLLRVQDSADYMPASQRNKVLTDNLGPEWRDLFDTFDEKPIAAASIGQVHSATLKSTGQRVAVKVQYPGVADSIDSDLSNLAILLTASRLLPKGLFLDKTIANARTELAWECDYEREAECGERFQRLLADEKDVFVVPGIIAEASGKHVITMEFMDGIGVTKIQNLTQEQRNWIGTQILRLCLREITEFRFMQSDPNWTNFQYNARTNKLELLDFGASREYPEDFIDKYTRLLLAASKSDKKTIRELSIDLGYLTGQESKAMLKAHIESVSTLAEPFLMSSPEVYDFKDQTITERVKSLIPVMIQQRLAPPPEETYSLHRKLSGAFLLCAKLGSQVRCRELFENSMTKAGLL